MSRLHPDSHPRPTRAAPRAYRPRDEIGHPIVGADPVAQSRQIDLGMVPATHVGALTIDRHREPIRDNVADCADLALLRAMTAPNEGYNGNAV